MSQSKINNTLFLIFGQGINFLFNLLMLPFLVRQLPLDTYATYSQVLLVTSTLYPILSLGIGNGMIAFFTSNKKHDFNVVLNGISNVILISILSYFCLFLFSDVLEQQLNNNHLWEFLKLFFFSVCIQICNDFFFNYLIFIHSSKIASILIIVNNILRLGAIYLAIASNLGLFYIFLFQIFALSIGFILFLSVIYKTIGFPKFQWDKNLNKRLIKLSIPLSLTTIIGVLLIQTDGFIISTYLGKIDYAYYRTGAIEIPFLSTVYASISLIFLPEFKRLINEEVWANIVELKKRLILNSALIIYPFIIYVLFFGKEFLLLYLGKAFIPSVGIFLIYNLVLFIRINDYSDILILKGKSNFIALSYLIVFAFNLIFGVISVKYLGINGPVIVTFISIFLIALAQLYKTCIILKTNIFSYLNFYKILTIIILDYLLIYLIYMSLKFIVGDNYLSIILTSFFFFLVHFTFIYKFDLIDASIKQKINHVFKKIWA